MKWDLSEDEIKVLSKLVALGKHMALAKESDFFSDSDREMFFELEEKIKRKLQVPETRQHEQNLTEHIAKYNDEIFWQELSYRLAERDLYKKYRSNFEKRSLDDIFRERNEFIKKYNAEFYENGLVRIVLNNELEPKLN